MAINDLADELGRAIAQNEIVPYYQPIVDLQTRRLTGFELLARWQHPVRQIIDPSEFIPLVEREGLIRVLTERLLQQACAHAVNWPAHIRLSVNISSLQLRETELAERLFQVAYEAHFPFHRLMFELTESAVIEDLELARSILGNLRSLGARLALDDFGTGYSGLHHLQVLPFDTLKLDATFVRSLSTSRESRKIVAAVVGLCQSMDLMTIAEGIESENQLETLRSLGYDSGQGWLFGRAVSAPETTSLLNAEPPTKRADSVAQIAQQAALRLEAMPIQCLWQLKALYEQAPVGLAFVDRKLRYLAVNERFAEMHGLPIAAFLGRSVAELFPEGIAYVEPRLRRALEGESIKDIKTRYAGTAGKSACVLQSSYHPVRDAAGDIIGISLAVVDVTAQEAASS